MMLSKTTPTAGLIPAHAGKTVAAARSVTWRGAHPRSRGENLRRSRRLSALRGSSPLTRGKPWRVRGVHDNEGLIPAHAGKTEYSDGTKEPMPAHPRSRGENLISIASVTSACGSSPLTRGKLAAVNPTFATVRLIPAHAGKTVQFAAALITIGAHPRSRGENFQRLCILLPIEGSSPLTRGKPGLFAQVFGRAGLIPAHAGKTYRDPMGRRVYWAHPRSRGENEPPGRRFDAA